MTPDKHIDWTGVPVAILMAAKNRYWDDLDHKLLVLFAGALITGMVYWGFSRTFNQMDRMEVKIDNTQTLAAEDRACVAALKERNDAVIKRLDEHINTTKR